jgi:hypothetical protein
MQGLLEFDGEHQKLLGMFRAIQDELERSNRWADELNARVGEHDARIGELQDELARDQENARAVVAGYNAKVAALEQENREKTQWAIETDERLSAEIQRLSNELVKAVAALERSGQDLEERTAWALRLDKEKRLLEEQLAMVRMSRWVSSGAKWVWGPLSDMAFLKRLLRALPLLLLSPFPDGGELRDSGGDAGAQVFRPRTAPSIGSPEQYRGQRRDPNWNGRDLMEKYLPSGSLRWRGMLKTKSWWWITDHGRQRGLPARAFPRVKVIALPKNLGFGGGSNAVFARRRTISWCC